MLLSHDRLPLPSHTTPELGRLIGVAELGVRLKCKMKFIAIFIVGVIFGVLILPRLLDPMLARDHRSSALGYCRDLALSIESYVSDYSSKHGTEPPTVPPPLQLNELGYLDADELKGIESSKGVYFVNYRPNMKNGESIVQWAYKDGVAYYNRGGGGEAMTFADWTKRHMNAEQGAAANP